MLGYSKEIGEMNTLFLLTVCSASSLPPPGRVESAIPVGVPQPPFPVGTVVRYTCDGEMYCPDTVCFGEATSAMSFTCEGTGLWSGDARCKFYI